MTEGVHYFELEAPTGCSWIYVGLVKPGLGRDGSKCSILQGYPSNDSAGWFMHLLPGALYGHGKFSEGNPGAIDGKLGDRLGVLANLDDGSVRFFKNGSPHGPGWPAGSVKGPVVLGVQMGYVGHSVRLFPPAQQKYREQAVGA